jgi:TolA-binding protein
MALERLEASLERVEDRVTDLQHTATEEDSVTKRLEESLKRVENHVSHLQHTATEENHVTNLQHKRLEESLKRVEDRVTGLQHTAVELTFWLRRSMEELEMSRLRPTAPPPPGGPAVSPSGASASAGQWSWRAEYEQAKETARREGWEDKLYLVSDQLYCGLCSRYISSGHLESRQHRNKLDWHQMTMANRSQGGQAQP